MAMNENERVSEDALKHIPSILTLNWDKDRLLQKLQSILIADLNSEDVLPAWTYYLELVIEPCGWLGVWFPSDQTAETFECESGRNGACIFEAVDVDPRDFNAEVELLRVPGTMKHVDQTIRLPLMEIYPIRDQENEHINVEKTAEVLELYRYFFKHLWRPWDDGSNVNCWPETHLTKRVSLMFDLAARTGNYGIAQRLEELASEAHTTRTELSLLEETAAELDDDVGMDEKLETNIAHLHLKTEEIRREAEVLEDPVLRQVVRAGKQYQRQKQRKNQTPGVILVWTHGTVQEMFELVTELQLDYEDKGLNLSPSVEHAFDIAVPNDVVIIAEQGEHQMTSLNGLTSGGRLLGRPAPLDSPVGRSTVLTPDNVGDVFLNVGGDIELSHLVLDLPPSLKIGILVTSGKLTMKNVTIQNGFVGLKVLSGGEAVLVNCSFDKCSKAVVKSKSAVVSMEQTQMTNCAVEVEEATKEELPALCSAGKSTGLSTSIPALVLNTAKFERNPTAKQLDFSRCGGILHPSSTPKIEVDTQDCDWMRYANSSQGSDLGLSSAASNRCRDNAVIDCNSVANLSIHDGSGLRLRTTSAHDDVISRAELDRLDEFAFSLGSRRGRSSNNSQLRDQSSQRAFSASSSDNASFDDSSCHSGNESHACTGESADFS